MKKAILIVLALAAFLPATVSLADGVKRGGKVTHVASVDGVLLFTVSSEYIEDRFTGPSCASTQRFAVPEGSSHAGVVLSLARVKNLVKLGGEEGAAYIQMQRIYAGLKYALLTDAKVD